MPAYYNEFDPFAAQWLRELIKKGLIADGEVDERSITDVQSEDIREFTQCHFFAGIGVWSYALRQAGWTDDRPVWTGSCPCQPFSSAGKGKGFKDERHLWPEFYRLISQCRPTVCFGEQVASKDGLAWVELVQNNMEGAGYAFGAVDTCSASFGAPHIRQRLYWVGADTLGNAALWGCVRGEMGNETGPQCSALGSGENEECWWHDVADDGACVRLDYASGEGLEGRWGLVQKPVPQRREREIGYNFKTSGTCGLAHTESVGRTDGEEISGSSRQVSCAGKPLLGVGDCSTTRERPGPTNGHWRDADWLFCRDGKWRAVEPGTFPLAYGAAARVGRLRGYGNAINAEQAKAFIKAYLEID